jgi:hypothetical protein
MNLGLDRIKKLLNHFEIENLVSRGKKLTNKIGKNS